MSLFSSKPSEKKFIEAVARILVLEYKMVPEQALKIVTDNWIGDDYSEHDRAGLIYLYREGERTGHWDLAVKDAVHDIVGSKYAFELRQMKKTIENVRSRMEEDGWEEEEIRVLLRDATPMFLKARKIRGHGDVANAIYGAIIAQYGELPSYVRRADA